MQKSKLIQLLRKLKKEELKEFDKFLKSPYHNSSPKLLSFFLMVKRHHKNNFTNSQLDKEKLFRHIYPNAPIYQDSNIRNLMTLLKSQLEDFLVINAIKNQTPIYNKLLSKVYKKWG